MCVVFVPAGHGVTAPCCSKFETAPDSRCRDCRLQSCLTLLRPKELAALSRQTPASAPPLLSQTEATRGRRGASVAAGRVEAGGRTAWAQGMRGGGRVMTCRAAVALLFLVASCAFPGLAAVLSDSEDIAVFFSGRTAASDLRAAPEASVSGRRDCSAEPNRSLSESCHVAHQSSFCDGRRRPCPRFPQLMGLQSTSTKVLEVSAVTVTVRPRAGRLVFLAASQASAPSSSLAAMACRRHPSRAIPSPRPTLAVWGLRAELRVRCGALAQSQSVGGGASAEQVVAGELDLDASCQVVRDHALR